MIIEFPGLLPRTVPDRPDQDTEFERLRLTILTSALRSKQRCSHQETSKQDRISPTPKRGDFLLRFQPVSLVILLAGMCGLSSPAQQAPGPAPAPRQTIPAGPPTASAGTTPSLTGLNSMQGLPVASVQIRCTAMKDTSWLDSLLLQKAGGPL